MPAILQKEFNISQGKAGVSASLYWQAAALVAAIVVFEVDIRLISDWKLRAAPSPFWPAGVLTALGIHLVFAVSTLVLWTWVVWEAWRRFPTPPQPNGHSLRHRLMARDQRRQRKRRGQRPLISRLRPHRLQPPGLTRLLAEIPNRRRHRLQRRLIGRHRLIRQASEGDGLQDFGPALHDFASTNRSSTFFNPAFSKEISSFSPSTPIIRP
jgi:hypothetical protein